MSFAEFMELALYDREIGYYCRAKERIGYADGTDFFTASTSGSLFGELVVAACSSILAAGSPSDVPPNDYTFVEIGVEGGKGILAGVAHSFAGVKAVGLGDPIAIEGPCVVFSNELFDAQPFRRFVFRQGEWCELGVALRGNELIEIELGVEHLVFLPFDAPEGYLLDAPLGSAALAEEIAAQSWTGLFVAFDYGKSWRELVEATPSGTARAYYRHTQSNDLLARPGEQDLTCHVCWDWLAEALTRNGFAAPTTDTQETFFVRHAGEFIAATSAAEAARFSQRKRALMQLLHPAHLGQKFQVLHSVRR